MKIDAAVLLQAYSIGVFPMADSQYDDEVFWIDPEERGILPLDGFRIPRSFRKFLKKHPYEVTFNRAFEDVIDGCATTEDDGERDRTWINETIRNWFLELHAKGHAHSVECWTRGGMLAGGLYGLSIGGAFFGESMFSLMSGASKTALVHLVARLKARGFALLDTQFVNDHLLQFGCVEITRPGYHKILENAIQLPISFADGASSITSGASSAGMAGVASSALPVSLESGAAASSAEGVVSSSPEDVSLAGVLAASPSVWSASSDWASIDGLMQSMIQTS